MAMNAFVCLTLAITTKCFLLSSYIIYCSSYSWYLSLLSLVLSNWFEISVQILSERMSGTTVSKRERASCKSEKKNLNVKWRKLCAKKFSNPMNYFFPIFFLHLFLSFFGAIKHVYWIIEMIVVFCIAEREKTETYLTKRSNYSKLNVCMVSGNKQNRNTNFHVLHWQLEFIVIITEHVEKPLFSYL